MRPDLSDVNVGDFVYLRYGSNKPIPIKVIRTTKTTITTEDDIKYTRKLGVVFGGKSYGSRIIGKCQPLDATVR